MAIFREGDSTAGVAPEWLAHGKDMKDRRGREYMIIMQSYVSLASLIDAMVEHHGWCPHMLELHDEVCQTVVAMVHTAVLRVMEVPVGEYDADFKRLIEITKQTLEKAIAAEEAPPVADRH